MTTQLFPDWTGEVENAWDQCMINGEAVPGVVSITSDYGGGIKAEKGNGLNGAFVRDTGLDIAKFTMVIKLLGADDARAYSDFYPKIFPTRSIAPRKPISIVHPALYTLAISIVIVDSISIGKPDAAKGLEVTWKLLEFEKPKPVIKRVIPTNPERGSPSGLITDPRAYSPADRGPLLYK